MPIVSVITDIHTRIYNLVGYTSPLRWRAKAYQIKATLADELASAAGTAAPHTGGSQFIATVWRAAIWTANEKEGT